MKLRTIFILATTLTLLPAGIAFADAPEDIVNNMFREVLKRNPTHEEFDYYKHLVIENGWDNSDLKRVLRQKKSEAIEREVNGDDGHDHHRDYGRDRGEYQEQGRDRSRYAGRDYYEKRRWVEGAFEDKVGRLPSRDEMDDYCDLCVEKRYNRSDLERQISDDYRGESRGMRREEDYRYNFDRYSNEEEVELIIEDIFRGELEQDVDDASMRKYRRLMIDEGWSEKRVRNDIVNSPELVRGKYEKIVVRAYEDLLERTPNPRERDGYVDDMMRQRWDERRLRDAIKRSREYSYDRPRRIIEQAYRETLLREADPGAYSLVSEINRHDWSIEDVKVNLRRSAEYRDQTIPKMLDIAYAELLNRKPDSYGIEFYTKRAREGWTFEQIKDHIRASDEYARTH